MKWSFGMGGYYGPMPGEKDERMNYEQKGPVLYRYCRKCRGMLRMVRVAHELWRCTSCKALGKHEA